MAMALRRLLRQGTLLPRAAAAAAAAAAGETVRATLFSGEGIGPEIAESVKQVVRGVVESLRVAECAFHYAKTNGRERVSAIHKADIMRKTDGLFLKCCREVDEKYPEITYEEVIIDNSCMTLQHW